MFKPNSACLSRHEDQQSRYDRNITGAFPEDDNLFIQRAISSFLPSFAVTLCSNELCASCNHFPCWVLHRTHGFLRFWRHLVLATLAHAVQAALNGNSSYAKDQSGDFLQCDEVYSD